MEASQASEAGSIPVARSTPARPRAGRFCYGCAGCARTTGIGAAISARGKAGAQRLHVVQTPHHFRWGGRHIAYETRRNVGWREKVRPAGGLQWLIREKTRPARAKTPNLGCFEHAGRTFSRTTHGDVAMLKPLTPLRADHQRPLKPTAPLRASPSWPMKPPSPLQALNTRKTSIFPAQRCHRFQASTHSGPQRCHRFHRDEAVH